MTECDTSIGIAPETIGIGTTISDHPGHCLGGMLKLDCFAAARLEYASKAAHQAVLVTVISAPDRIMLDCAPAPPAALPG